MYAVAIAGVVAALEAVTVLACEARRARLTCGGRLGQLHHAVAGIPDAAGARADAWAAALGGRAEEGAGLPADARRSPGARIFATGLVGAGCGGHDGELSIADAHPIVTEEVIGRDAAGARDALAVRRARVDRARTSHLDRGHAVARTVSGLVGSAALARRGKGGAAAREPLAGDEEREATESRRSGAGEP